MNVEFEGGDSSVVDIDSFELTNTENCKTGFVNDWFVRVFRTLALLIKTFVA